MRYARRFAPTTAILPAILLAAAAAAHAQERAETPPPTDWSEAVAVLETADSVDDSAVGYGGIKSDTWKAYEVLRDDADRARLLELTDHAHPVVRAYALWALVERHPQADIAAILADHLHDTAEVRRFRGCIMSKRMVGDVMFEFAGERLGEAETAALAARLVAEDSKLDVRGSLLRSGVLGERHVPRLRDLADDGDDDALIALAHHGRKADAARIAKALGRKVETIRDLHLPLVAARIFPHETLREPLADLLILETRFATEHRARPAWYAAVAAHENAWAADLMAEALDAVPAAKRRWVARAITDALAPHKDVEAFADLRLRVAELLD